MNNEQMKIIRYSLFNDYWVPLIEKCYNKGLVYDKNKCDFISTEVFNNLFKLYNQKHRKYHNSNHILTLLNLNNQISIKRKIKLDNEEAIQFAIFFYDSMYDTNLDEYFLNEERSALYANSQLNKLQSTIQLQHMEDFMMTFSLDFVELVQNYIIDTHYVTGEYDFLDCYSDSFRNNIEYLHDLDFSYLGYSDFDIFLYLTNQIKKEFSWWFRTFHFDKKRRQFLLNLLDQNKTIFKTEYFIENYENQARKNINDFLKLNQ